MGDVEKNFIKHGMICCKHLYHFNERQLHISLELYEGAPLRKGPNNLIHQVQYDINQCIDYRSDKYNPNVNEFS